MTSVWCLKGFSGRTGRKDESDHNILVISHSCGHGCIVHWLTRTVVCESYFNHTLATCLANGHKQHCLKEQYKKSLMTSIWVATRFIILTKLHLCYTYYLVWIKKGVKGKTAFNPPAGYYEVMPIGLTNAPAVFQNLVNVVVGEMLNKCLCLLWCHPALRASSSGSSRISYLSRQRNVSFMLPLFHSWDLFYMLIALKRLRQWRHGQPLRIINNFFFNFCGHHLISSEQNYDRDIGHREPLAVKLGLEERHHWLEGVEQSFIVLTGIKNWRLGSNSCANETQLIGWRMYSGLS